jgi:hypothetical protein
MTSRTSIHSYSGSPPGPGSEETYAASLERALAGLDVDHVPARDQVAGLGSGPSVVTGAASGPP